MRLQNIIYSKKISEIAFEIEHNILENLLENKISMLEKGGVNQFYFNKNNSVSIKKINLSNKSLNNLNKNLVIFFTGYSRDSYKILKFSKQTNFKIK